MMMKRLREGSDVEDINTLANCLMLLSGNQHGGGRGGEINRVFECKTCNRQFPSFQALGGHRASHKKPRLSASGDDLHLREPSPPKPKTHECAICGLEFPIGQALGGHMRRHRSAATAADQKRLSSPELSLSPPVAPIVKKSNSRRVFCVDLNLTPSENKFLFGNVVPVVDCFF